MVLRDWQSLFVPPDNVQWTSLRYTKVAGECVRPLSMKDWTISLGQISVWEQLLQ